MTTTHSPRALELRHAQALYLEHATTFRNLAAETHEHAMTEPLVDAPFRGAVVQAFLQLASHANDAADRADLYATGEELADGAYCQSPCRPHDHEVCETASVGLQHAVEKVRGVA